MTELSPRIAKGEAIEPQMLLRSVTLSDRNEVEQGTCAECSLTRLLVFDMAYDWKPGITRELFSICDSCGLELLTNSKALEDDGSLSILADAAKELRAYLDRKDAYMMQVKVSCLPDLDRPRSGNRTGEAFADGQLEMIQDIRREILPLFDRLTEKHSASAVGGEKPGTTETAGSTTARREGEG